MKNTVVARCFEGNALLEIILTGKGERDPDLDYGYADISELSEYSYEEEVLINPLNTFQVLEYE